MARRKARTGFTLVELLVVITIIGMLVSLALPVINNARESGRQLVCKTRVRQLAIAMGEFERNNRRLPGWLNMLKINGQPYKNPNTGTQQGVSWVVMILDQLQQPLVYDAWRKSTSSSSGGGSQSGGANNSPQVIAQNQRVYIDVLECPSDPMPGGSGTPLAYVLNAGIPDSTSSGGSGGGGGGGGTGGGGQTQSQQRDNKANAMFFDLYTPVAGQQTAVVPRATAIAGATDGPGQTLMVSENVDANEWADGYNSQPLTEQLLGFCWDSNVQVQATGQLPYTATPSNDTYRINNSKGDAESQGFAQVYFARPSSRHPGGVVVSFCDSRTVFLNDQIDYFVYCLLMTPDGAHATKGGTTPIQNLGFPANANWYTVSE